MNQTKLNKVLRLHKLWINGEPRGKRADLRDADLSDDELRGADLHRADMRYAYLRDADLRYADLRYADLRDADLRGADLRGADLHRADMRYADLSDAELRGADLHRADMRYAYLRDADLRGADIRDAFLYHACLCKVDLRDAVLCDADLRDADLRGADLRDADLRGANLYRTNLLHANLEGVIVDETTKWFALRCPAEGAYIGYKKCRDGLIVELEIPADAKRSSATTEKCRASKAKVLSITKLDGTPADVTEAVSQWDKTFVYRIGETVEVKDFDEDRWNECSTGIHHFINRQEAVEYFL